MGELGVLVKGSMRDPYDVKIIQHLDCAVNTYTRR